MDDPKMRAVPCPSCARPMKLARSVEREYGRLIMQVFECDRCRVSYTEGRMNDGKGDVV